MKKVVLFFILALLSTAGWCQLSVTPASLFFPTTLVGTTSAAETFSLSGSSLVPLSGSLTVTAPTGFDISPDGVSWATSFTITYTGGSLSATTVYVEFAPTSSGTFAGNATVTGGGSGAALVALNGAGGPVCSGTPAAGTASASVGTACATTPVTLTDAGYSTTSGITFQWQSSADSTTWTNMSGATSPTYSFAGVSANTYYRCTVTCSASGISAHTNMALITYSSTCSSMISAVPSSLSFGYVTTGTSSTMTTSLTASGLVPSTGTLTVTAPSGFMVSADGVTWAVTYTISYTGGSLSGTTVYVQFDPTATTSYSGNATVSGGGIFLNIPLTGMGTGSGACSGTPAPGTASSGVSIACVTTPVTLTDAGYSSASGITFQWQSSPDSATWTNISGATAATWSFTGLSTNTYYRCTVTCSYSGISAQTNIVEVSYSSSCTASMSATPDSLSFGLVTVGTSSSTSSSTLSGSSLFPATGSLTVTAPSGFMVSADGSTWETTYTISYSGGAVTSTIYVQFDPTAAIIYSGDISVAGGGGSLNIPLYGTGISSGSCTGTPVAGTASVSASASCAISTVTLSLSGYSTTTGITFQWQSSTDSTTWSNIAGATSASWSYTGTLTSTVYFRCVVTCSYSGLSSSSAMATLTVDEVYGHISFSSTPPDTLSLRVWLIVHDTTLGTLTAVDSQVTCVDGGAAYYGFTGMAYGDYLVKAMSLDITSSTVGSSGYVPTYGLSNPHWDTAVTVHHTHPSDTMHINMVYGTVPPGPGFIGGLISSGAGKNTTVDFPAAGMLVYLIDATTNTILTYNYTDGSGSFAFSGIGNGSYIIYPEAINYVTTPSSVIVLNAASETVNAVDFRQSTTFKTITPHLNTVVPVANPAEMISVFPNPSAGMLTLQWAQQVVGDANIMVTDVTGRVVLQSVVGIHSVSGSALLNVSSLNDGIYFINVRTEKSGYNEKLLIRK